METYDITSGRCSHNYGKSSFCMGRSTISMAIFNSQPTVSLPEGNFHVTVANRVN